MKKLFSLMLALMLLCSCAMAGSVVSFGSTGYTLNIDSLTNEKLTAEDKADDMLLHLTSKDGSIECALYTFDTEGLDMAAVAAAMEELIEDTLVDSGWLKLNGIDVFRMTETDEEDDFVHYILADDDAALQISWYYADKAARKQVESMMATLSKPGAAAGGKATIPNSTLTIGMGDMVMLELDQEDMEDDMVLAFMNEEETMECMVWCYTADGYTLADMAEELAEEEGCVSSGYTNINGIDAYFWVGTDDGDTLVEYFVIDGEMIVEIAFYCADDAAAQVSGIIMNTLSK